MKSFLIIILSVTVLAIAGIFLAPHFIMTDEIPPEMQDFMEEIAESLPSEAGFSYDVTSYNRLKHIGVISNLTYNFSTDHNNFVDSTNINIPQIQLFLIMMQML